MTIQSLNYRLAMQEARIKHLYCYLQANPGGTETDPIFSASPAATITQQDIINWNAGGSTPGLQAVTDIGRVTTNPIESGDYITGAFLAVKQNGFIGSIDGSLLTEGESYQLPPKSGTFALLDDIHPEIDTLETVVTRNNYVGANRWIGFTATSGVANRNAALGMNPTTFSFFFGNMNPAHTGAYNLGIGFNSLTKITNPTSNVAYGHFTGPDITTGAWNTLIGGNSGLKITTGNENTLIGGESGQALTTGFKNAFFGRSSGYQSVASSLNTLLGYKSGLGGILGDRNIIIGAAAGQNMTGSGNVIIGSGAGYSEINVTNKLIIHNNTTWTGYSNTAEGVFGTPNQGTSVNGLILGDFAARWVKLNGYFQIGPSYMPNAQGDATYTKSIVAKSDGTFGWEDKVATPEYIEKQAFVSEYNRTSDYLTIGFMLRSKYPTISTPSVSKTFITVYASNVNSGDPQAIGSGHDLTTPAILKWGYGASIAHESGNKGLLTGTIRIPAISTEISYLQGLGYVPIQVVALLSVTINGVTTNVTFNVPFM